MSLNTTTASAANSAAINQTQLGIAGLEDQYQSSISGAGSKDQDELRNAMAQMRVLLGEMRIRAKELVQEQLENQKANKGLSELAKA